MRVTLINPTGCNTKAHIITVNEHQFYFSYETCIAYRGPELGSYRRLRLPNLWGPTTGRHFRELGCADFIEVSPEQFEATLEDLR